MMIKRVVASIALTLILCATSFAQVHTLTKEDVKFDVESGSIVSYVADYDSIFIPPSIDGVTVCDIGTGAFLAKGIKKLELPLTLKTIGIVAFSRNSIDTLTIPDNVECIGGAAFQFAGLRYLTLPQNIKHIGGGAFSDNEILTVEIPSSLDTIRGFAGAGIREVTIPSTVSVVDSDAFAMNHFDKITIKEGVRKIGYYAFGVEKTRVESDLPPLPDDPHISSLQIPSTVTDIGDFAFLRQRSIHTLTLKDGLVNIGKQSFFFNHIDTLIIPSTVERIGEQAFMSNWMDSLLLGSGVSSLGKEAFCGNFLRYVNYPPKLSTLPAGCFSGNQLTEADIPSTVTAIGDECFAYNKISKVKVPGTVDEIGSGAFSYNVELTSVTLGEGVTTIGEYAFAYCCDMSNVNDRVGTLSLPSTLREIKPNAFYRTYITPTRLPQYNADKTKELVWYKYDGTRDNVTGEVETIGNAGFAYYDSQLGFYAVEKDAEQPPAALVSPGCDDADTVYSVYDISGRFVGRGKSRDINLPKGLYVLRCNGTSRKIVVE